MRVVDTSLWIELITKGKLVDAARQAIEPLNTCIVPAMVHYELRKWCARVLSPDDATSVMGLLTECQTAEMDLTVAIEAAALSATHKLHATDAIIYATAQLHNAKLFTSDAHFMGLPGVDYVEKDKSAM
jgi:predicted nucleic acid-binding protein